MASGYLQYIRRNSRPYIESLRDDIDARKDTEYFQPSGTQVYCGRQGSGKTVSAVKHLLDLKRRYPKAIVVSNIRLNYFEPRHFANKEELKRELKELDATREYIEFRDLEELEIALTRVNNGKYGVIYLVDEIHTYFNALESKNIPMYVFTEISQQRKQRKLIVGTSQLFLRMAKPFREQCDNVIICNTILGIFTVQRAFDGMSITQDYDGKLSGEHKKTGWFVHNRRIRGAFDTYQKVVSGAEQYEQVQRVEMVEARKKHLFQK